MDFPKRERALPQGSSRRSPKAMRSGAATEADENASPKRPVPAWAASPQKKKVLGERNDGGGAGSEAAASPPPPQPKPAPSPPTLTGRGAGAYDPKTNCTTPRPEFLRYDPERRREILLRLARAAEVEYDDSTSAASGSAVSEDDCDSVTSDAAAASPASSEAELDDSDDDEEEEEVPAHRGRWAWRLFLLLVGVACSFCYIYCMNPAAYPIHPEDGFDFYGPIGGMYDVSDHEVDSLRLLGPLYMMGPEDMLEETTNQIVHRDSEDVVHLRYQRASPGNMVAVTIMGLGDICLDVPLGELTCQIGGECSETVADLKEDYDLDKHETEVAIESIKKDEQTSGCLGENISVDSIGSTSTHTADTEVEDHSNQFVPQVVSKDNAMESASDKLDDRSSSEIEELMNLNTELWQYENTAEAAKAIFSIAKFLWSAVEPHLVQILACLSAAGFVAAIFRYFQRSRDMVAPASQPSPQAVQLPVYSPEQPTQLTVPEQGLSGSLEIPMKVPLLQQDPFVSLKDPVQELLPKIEPFVSLKVPKHDQKLRQQDASNMKPSNGNFLNHRKVDSSKPPVVELLGEFSFANNSRGSSIKNLDQYAGDAAVQELLEKDVDKMQMNLSIFQNPSVTRGRKEENSTRAAKIDATPAPLLPTPVTPTPLLPTPVTPTPLRRSNRLRNKLTSP